uniref:Kinesin motor domain-containing protein n=1 Tax=Ascaris lumbricoides TaxID=6252 RepID=A0A0M3IRS7_ASCLU
LSYVRKISDVTGLRSSIRYNPPPLVFSNNNIHNRAQTIQNGNISSFRTSEFV